MSKDGKVKYVRYVYIKDQAGDTPKSLSPTQSHPKRQTVHPPSQSPTTTPRRSSHLPPQEKPNKNKNKTMPSQLLTLLLSSMLLTLSTAGLVPLERRAIGCGTCYEVGSKRITINGGNSCYVDCSLQQVDSASEVCCVSSFFLPTLPYLPIPCVYYVGDGTKEELLANLRGNGFLLAWM